MLSTLGMRPIGALLHDPATDGTGGSIECLEAVHRILDPTHTFDLCTVGEGLIPDLAEVDPIVARGLARHCILSDKLAFRKPKSGTNLDRRR